MDLVKLLVRNKVVFLVIGGQALLHYSQYRETSDLDILLSRSKGNAIKLAKAFESNNWQHPNGKSWVSTLTKRGLRLAYPSHENKEVDLLTSINGLDFGRCYERSIKIKLDELDLRVPTREDLIEMKKISMRSGNDNIAQEKDAADIAELSRLIYDAVPPTVKPSILSVG